MFLNHILTPKITHMGTKKSNKHTKIEGIIEYKSCSAIQIDPNNIFECYPNPHISPLGPETVKRTPKLGKY